MRPFKVVVTKAFIDAAIQRDNHRCMEIFGLKYGNDDLERIRVTRDKAGKLWFSFSSRSEQLRYTKIPAPRIAEREAERFDQDKSLVKPHSYTVDPDLATKVAPVGRQSSATMSRRYQRPRRSYTPGVGRSMTARKAA